MKILIIAAMMVVALAQQRIMFFHHGHKDVPQKMDLTDLRNSPSYVVLDCSTYNCHQFVKTDYPALYYWKGPGSAFERIHPPTQESARAHLLNKQNGFLNRFIIYLQQITLFETFIYAALFAGFLCYVFTLLFSPPAHHKKNKKRQ